jgi:hypothetical protein
VKKQSGNRDPFQILGEISFRKLGNTVVLALDSAKHALQPKVLPSSLRNDRAAAIEAEERHSQIFKELGAVFDQTFTECVEDVHRRTLWITGRLQHYRWHRADQNGLRYATATVSGDITGHFTATRRVPNQNHIAKIEDFDEGSQIIGINIHRVVHSDLSGAPMALPVMSNDPIAFVKKEKHLRVPRIPSQGPAVTEHNWLARTPVLVKQVYAVPYLIVDKFPPRIEARMALMHNVFNRRCVLRAVLCIPDHF